MKEVSWQTWAYEANKGDLICSRGMYAIMLEDWVDAAKKSKSTVSVFTSLGVLEIEANVHVTIFRFHDE